MSVLSKSIATFARRAAMASTSGFVFAASTPPIDFQPGILLGLVGFAFALLEDGPEDAPDNAPADENEKKKKKRKRSALRTGAWRGFLFGLAANLLALRFVPEVMQRFTPLPRVAGWVALLLLSAAQALPWLAAGALARWLVHPTVSFPLGAAPPNPREKASVVPLRSTTSSKLQRHATPSWLAFGVCVYFACFIPAVFPWTPAGGLSRWPLLLQTAELIGERGTSLLVAYGCGLLAASIDCVKRAVGASRQERFRAGAPMFAIGIGIFVVLLIHGSLRADAIETARSKAPHARVALLQPDFDAMFRWEEHRASMMMDRLSALTKRAESEGAELTIWPESAYPYTLAHGVKRSPRGTRAVLQQGVHGPVLTGAYLTKGGGLGTNSAILASETGDIGPSYDKRHLLWFGETVPMADTFPVLRRIFARGTGIDAGTESVPFRTGAIVAAVLNCYEDTLPVAGREAMEVRPNLLVNVTNDAWFAGSAEGELHLRLAILRAIETRRDLVRAVNRGPTTWVDATGRIRMRRDSTPGLGPSPPLLADVSLLDSPLTLYTRAGDVPLFTLVLLAVIGPWLVAWRKRNEDPQQTS